MVCEVARATIPTSPWTRANVPPHSNVDPLLLNLMASSRGPRTMEMAMDMTQGIKGCATAGGGYWLRAMDGRLRARCLGNRVDIFNAPDDQWIANPARRRAVRFPSLPSYNMLSGACRNTTRQGKDVGSKHAAVTNVQCWYLGACNFADNTTLQMSRCLAEPSSVTKGA
jgi:hypothetical protein